MRCAEPEAGLRARTDLCARVAAGARDRLARAGGSLRPPVPIERMVCDEGFRILRLGAMEDAVAGLVSLPDRIIAVNGRHHPRRQRFTLAHELAHVLLRHPPEERCSIAARAVFNREADLCASHLLIPADLLREFTARGAGLVPLALLFDVSLEALGRRLQEVRLSASLQR